MQGSYPWCSCPHSTQNPYSFVISFLYFSSSFLWYPLNVSILCPSRWSAPTPSVSAGQGLSSATYVVALASALAFRTPVPPPVVICLIVLVTVHAIMAFAVGWRSLGDSSLPDSHFLHPRQILPWVSRWVLWEWTLFIRLPNLPLWPLFLGADSLVALPSKDFVISLYFFLLLYSIAKLASTILSTMFAIWCCRCLRPSHRQAPCTCGR